MGDLSDEGFEDIEEQDLAFVAWLRASPLLRIQEYVKKEASSSSCNKYLFNISSSQSRCETIGKSKEAEEGEVEQQQVKTQIVSGEKPITNKGATKRCSCWKLA